jgi:DNA adenine methylase
MKPFISYIGSKQKIMKQIEPYLPKEINNYYEPFVGGGSMFLYVNQNYDIKKNFINDFDYNLINTYKVIKNDINNLMDCLDMLNKFSSKKDFDKLVNIYNYENINNILKSAIYIFMNKRAYNGNLHYRKDKTINPYYSSQHIKRYLFNKDNLENISLLLNKTIIKNKDFISFINEQKPKKGDFVFFDPPYLVDNVKQYYENTFLLDDYKILKQKCDQLNNENVKFMLTLNKHSSLVKMFEKYNIKTFKKFSSISKGEGYEYEMIITNYDV